LTDRFHATSSEEATGIREIRSEELVRTEDVPNETPRRRKLGRKLDYSYSGPQPARIARMQFGGKIELGAVHTYLQLFAR
jgi:Malonate decarboxylase, alpha subunit, transporter